MNADMLDLAGDAVRRVDFGYFVRPGSETESGEPRVEPVLGYVVRSGDNVLLVDTGMGSHPEVDAHYRPRRRSLDEALAPLGLRTSHITHVTNCHLHFDHCGGNRRFAGLPMYVQRVELAAARAPAYLEEWVHFDGASYVEVDGDAELFDGVSVLFTPGHSPGHQAVVVGDVVLGGDVTYSMRELIDGATPSIRRIHDLRPRRVYLAHHERPWEPEYDSTR